MCKRFKSHCGRVQRDDQAGQPAQQVYPLFALIPRQIPGQVIILIIRAHEVCTMQCVMYSPGQAVELAHAAALT